MAIAVENRIKDVLATGIVECTGCRIVPATSRLRERCASLAEQVVSAGQDADGAGRFLSSTQRSAVRSMLRSGGFSPTGRNRPAQELLVRMILELGVFPHINNAVDVNNLMSVQYGWPISILNASLLEGKAILRYGSAGERYIFNQSGHEIEVKNCVVTCGAGDVPLGSPVKDSMAVKLGQDTQWLAAVAYFPAGEVGSNQAQFRSILEGFGSLLAEETGGSFVEASLH